MNNIFDGLSSNTLSANGNQTFITDNIPEDIGTGLVFIKVFCGGTFNYKFVFSGVIDSTFAEGNISRCNDKCDWTIENLSVAITKTSEPDNFNFIPVTFDGDCRKYIGCEDFVISDAVTLSADKNEYICLKIEFSGNKIPCHRESIIPIYRLIDNNYILCPEVPVPVFTGIEYIAEKKIAWLGDSITQGIGSSFNSYNNYSAVASEIIGEKYSYWNIGLGFGRASDVASKGIWLEKAKQNDVVAVCFGVNDIFKEHNADKLKNDLLTIVTELKAADLKVLIQSVPPFDYDEEYRNIWFTVNEFIKNELSALCDGYFDNIEILKESDCNIYKAKYGGHPNDEGGIMWGKAIAPDIIKLLK